MVIGHLGTRGLNATCFVEMEYKQGKGDVTTQHQGNLVKIAKVTTNKKKCADWDRAVKVGLRFSIRKIFAQQQL